MKSKVTDDDKKWREIKRRMKEVKNSFVDVGIQSDAGTGDTGTPIAAYAAWNEFGTSTIPSRSFIRSTADEQRTDWNRLGDGLMSRVLRLEMTTEQALSLLGEKAQADIKQKIIALREPPNSPATIQLKGSSNPLINTGAMLNSIRYVVSVG